MTPEELKEISVNFHSEITSRAHAAEAFKEHEYVEFMGELLTEAGEIENCIRCSYQDHDQNHGPKVDAYDHDDELTSLTLIISGWRDQPDPFQNKVSESQIATYFRRCQGFFRKSLNGLYSRIEISNEAYDLSVLIHDNRQSFDRINLILVTNGLAKDRPAETEMIDGVVFNKVVWDISRTLRFMATGEREGIVVNFEQDFGGALPAVVYTAPSGNYTTYLSYIPGRILADIYDRWGTRLLEMNVRVFLSARGGVNKGIKETIINDPHMFCAYNNGITAFAREVCTSETGNGVILVSSANDFQIVNGGQTTASLYHAWKKNKNTVDLQSIAVQMKLTVLSDPEEAGAIVPKISEYSNTQNKIQTSDLSANDPPHPELQALSMTTPAPDPTGGSKETYWFYEKSRGSYEETRNLTARTPAQKRKFDELRPKKQKFDKNQLGKAWNTYLILPFVVSLGTQKNFARFNQWLKEQKDEDWSAFYMKTVSLVILWNRAESIVRRQKFEGYRHNIVTYTLAWLFHITDSMIDLDRIWKSQEVDPALLDFIEQLCHHVDKHIRKTQYNVTEWCKKEDCWNRLREIKVDMPPGIAGCCYQKASNAGSYDPSLPSEQEAVDFCMAKTSEEWWGLAVWLKEREFLSSKARSQCGNMAKAIGRKSTPSVVLSRACMKAWKDAEQRGWKGVNDEEE